MTASEHDFRGMTVNERLFVSGKMDAFDQAINDKDIERAREILRSVDLEEANIRPVLVAVGLIKD